MAHSSGMRDCHDDHSETRDDIPLKETPGSEEAPDEEEEEREYPPMLKFLPILIGLCFQSFCIALVRTPGNLIWAWPFLTVVLV